MKNNRDRILLERMIEAIGRIQRYIEQKSEADFLHDEMAYDACLMQHINIGELVNHLSEEFTAEHAYFPWHKATGMRN